MSINNISKNDELNVINVNNVNDEINENITPNIINYSFDLKHKEPINCQLHTLQYKGYFPTNIRFNCRTTSLIIKLTGKSDILNITESVLLYTNNFDLKDYINIIMSSDKVNLNIIYIGTELRELFNVEVQVDYNYYEPKIIYNNIYRSLDNDTYITILTDIKNTLIRSKYMILTSDGQLNSLTFEPKFKSNINILDTYNVSSDNNKIVFQFPEYFNENIDSYKMICDMNCNSKLGLIIYGY